MTTWSGHDIASWFRSEVALSFQQVQTAEGYDLETGDDGYCYVWVMAFVDLDMDAFFLLDVRTKQGTEDETRDFLFTGVGASFGKGVPHEWQNKPLPFRADAEAHRERLSDGLKWFAERIEFWQEEVEVGLVDAKQART